MRLQKCTESELGLGVSSMVALYPARVHIHLAQFAAAPARTNQRISRRAMSCMLDVAVVGAGPGGLAAAAALIRCSTNPSGVQVSFHFVHVQAVCVEQPYTCTFGTLSVKHSSGLVRRRHTPK